MKASSCQSHVETDQLWGRLWEFAVGLSDVEVRAVRTAKPVVEAYEGPLRRQRLTRSQRKGGGLAIVTADLGSARLPDLEALLELSYQNVVATLEYWKNSVSTSDASGAFYQ